MKSHQRVKPGNASRVHGVGSDKLAKRLDLVFFKSLSKSKQILPFGFAEHSARLMNGSSFYHGHLYS